VPQVVHVLSRAYYNNEMAGLAEGSSRESVVSLQDVIETDAELEQMANAVLGASDDKKCTYSQVNTIHTE